jgi:DNA polymerase V
MYVNGNSMTGAGISHGDLLIIDRSVKALHGHIVIARVYGELTVKRYTRKGKRTVLEAANPDFNDIEIGADTEFDILGVVRNCVKIL